MKLMVGFLAMLALAVVIVLISRLPSEDAIRLAGYAATAAFAALVGLLVRRRASRAQQNKRAG